MTDGEYVGDDDLQSTMVQSALTSTATFIWGDGEQTSMLELRVFTLNGDEHHLLWPIQAALPLLESIMHVAMMNLGSPTVYGDAEFPNTIEGLFSDPSPDNDEEDWKET